MVTENPAEQYVTDGKTFHIETSTKIVSSSETVIYKDLKSEVTKRSEEEETAKQTSIHADSAETYVPEEQGADGTTMDRVTRRIYASSQSLNGSQQDLSNSSEETQATDVWRSPRERGLKLLREEERFEIRSQRPETSPTKLFVDSDGDDDGKVRPRSRELTPEKVLELEKNRREIIKKQGQRKSLDTEDAINISNVELAEADGGQDRPNVHTEQIHFESARQQFIKLEKERNSLPIMPRPQPRQPRLSTSALHEKYQVTKEHEDREGESKVTPETARKDRSSGHLRRQFFKSFSVDSADSWEEEKSAPEIPEEKESAPNPSDETPIEREIRLALEREESLRKERGILSSGETKEIIEISKNPVSANSPDLSHSKKRKNRRHTSLYIQKEIEKEVQREDDLKSEGRVAGLYDKGDSQELDERRKLFEQPDDIPVQPQQGSSAKITKETTYSVKEDTSQAEPLIDEDAKNWTVVDSAQPYSVRMRWKPAPFNVYRSRRLSADNILDIKTPAEKSSEKETSEETFVLRKENFSFQPLKFNLQDNEGEVGKDNKTGHKERYNPRLRPSLSNIIEQEIQKTLERDRELQEERKKMGLAPLTVHTDNELHSPENGYDTQGTSSAPTNVSHSWSSPWKGTLGNKSASFDSSTVQIFRPHAYPKFEAPESDRDRLKRHESQYAGIDSSDAVNTEIVESTRVNRHKNTMALRWEAGLFANEQSD